MIAFNLTAWGYQDCQFDKNDGSFKGMLPKLLFRTLPKHYPLDSVYSHFPFIVPRIMEQYLNNLPVKPYWKYTFTRPKKPETRVVKTVPEIVGVLKDKTHFEAGYTSKLMQIVKGNLVDRAVVR